MKAKLKQLVDTIVSTYNLLTGGYIKKPTKPPVKKTNFEKYCDENPSALECRIYDN
jgi:hypothetical protein